MSPLLTSQCCNLLFLDMPYPAIVKFMESSLFLTMYFFVNWLRFGQDVTPESYDKSEFL